MPSSNRWIGKNWPPQISFLKGPGKHPSLSFSTCALKCPSSPHMGPSHLLSTDWVLRYCCSSSSSSSIHAHATFIAPGAKRPPFSPHKAPHHHQNHHREESFCIMGTKAKMEIGMGERWQQEETGIRRKIKRDRNLFFSKRREMNCVQHNPSSSCCIHVCVKDLIAHAPSK